MGQNLIFKTTDRRVIPSVMEMIRKSKVANINLNEMELFLRTNLEKEDTRLWVVFDGDKINGFLFAYLVFPHVIPEVFIAWTYIDPKCMKIGKELIKVVENWAKSLGVKKLSAMVHNNIKAFEKKYGFKLESYVVAKDLSIKEEKNVGTV